jgi:hypothetical protein
MGRIGTHGISAGSESAMVNNLGRMLPQSSLPGSELVAVQELFPLQAIRLAHLSLSELVLQHEFLWVTPQERFILILSPDIMQQGGVQGSFTKPQVFSLSQARIRVISRPLISLEGVLGFHQGLLVI